MPSADNLVHYTMDYVRKRHSLSDEQARRFCLNPDLTFAMQMEAFNTSVWASSEMMDTVKAHDFDAPNMKEINDFIDSFARTYASNEPKIMDYLRSLGHPLGGARGTPRGSGCALVLAFISIPTAILLWLM
jgi:hypothetical protein